MLNVFRSTDGWVLIGLLVWWVYLSEECILVMPDGNVLVLRSVGDDLN